MTYKKDVPDFRNSLSIEIFKLIKKKYSHVEAFDPFANLNSVSKVNIKYKVNFDNFDHVFFLTNHTKFEKYKKNGKKFTFLFESKD